MGRRLVEANGDRRFKLDGEVVELQGPLRDRRRHVEARADPRRVRRRGRWLVGAAGGMRVSTRMSVWLV